MQTVRRTFEAKKHPKGSPERAALNVDWLTSEYYSSYKYGVRTDDGAETPWVFTSKAEADAKAKELTS